MQAIEFKTILNNGIVAIPSQYSPQWEGKAIRVIIVLEDLENSANLLESLQETQLSAVSLNTQKLQFEQSDTNPLKGSVKFESDLISTIDESWNAEQ
ncbi:MAG: hypothetical protein F6J86_04770 [Symploca sp. SIO1B1]|nr:hypothetical protein [Symploca sp. SIO1B1]